MEIKDTGYAFLEYLGDSVYVGFDGYHYWLMTWNGHYDDPRNKIALEPPIFEALKHWVNRVKQECIKEVESKGE